MTLARSALASVTLAFLAACGLNAAGDLPLDGSVGTPDASGQARDAVGHDSHVGEGDAHSGDAHAPADQNAPDAPMSADASEGSTPPMDAGHDVNMPPDSGNDTGNTTCPSTPDCSNAACMAEGYACVPAATGGWNLASVDFASDSACPADYTAQANLVTSPTGGPAVCGCGACGIMTAPSCVSGTVDTSYDLGLGGCNSPYPFDAHDGQCSSATFALAQDLKVTSTPGLMGGMCSASASNSVPPSGSSSVFVCAPATPPPTTGCPGGEVCTATTSVRSRCVVSASQQSCPTGYTKSHTVGTGVNDTRKCTGMCACGPPTGTCIDPALTFYTGSACSGNVFDVNMDGSCDSQNGAGTMYTTYKYTATPQAACGTVTTTPMPSGNLMLTGPETVCCQ